MPQSGGPCRVRSGCLVSSWQEAHAAAVSCPAAGLADATSTGAARVGRAPADLNSCATAAWPRAKRAWFDASAERQVEFLQELVVAVRNLRAESGVAPGRMVSVVIRGSGEQLDLVHTLEARRGTKARFAAFIGMAAAFAVYLSTHTGKDVFGRVYAAFFMALLIGGGAGLLAGELLARAFKKA